jgi:hypothetical protein
MKNTHNELAEQSDTFTEEFKDWEYPVPFTTTQIEDIPYPTHALPSILQSTVTEYQQYGQQPIALIACSALANISLACQSLANVARDNYLLSPISLYFCIGALSGERKSASDSVFSRAAREWEETISEELAPTIRMGKAMHNEWQKTHDTLMTKLKNSSFSDNGYIESELEELLLNEPEVPLQPTLYFEDITQEALAHYLAIGWPSASLWSDEGGIVLGSHSMQSNPTKFVALLNRLWDAKKFITHRKTSEQSTLKHRRLTLNLMMQPILMKQFLLNPNSISRQSGFLPRCLLANPNSSMGQRFYLEPQKNTKTCFEAYDKRITECLSQSEDLTVDGCINLPTLHLSPVAKKQWVHFFNGVESGLGTNGQWTMMRDFASKAGENAARMAALFHLFEGKEGDISVEHTEQAINIIDWHLQETRRLLTMESTSAPTLDAQKLMNWLIEKDMPLTSTREIQRLSTLRDKPRLNDALTVLVEYNRIKVTKTGNKTMVEVNPHCF